MKSYQKLALSALTLCIGLYVSSPLYRIGEPQGEEGDNDYAPNLHRMFPAKDVRHYENEIYSGYPNIDVIVSPNDGYAQGETSVAINPVKPNMMVAASNDFRGINGGTNAYVYYSTNSGQTWLNKVLQSVPTTGLNSLSDPSLTYDADGDAFYCYGAFFRNGNGATGNSVIVVTPSYNGGTSWDVPVVAKSNDANSFEDKYIIAADATSSSPHKNNLYVSWTHFVNSGTFNQTMEIFCVRSTNKGASWMPAVQVSTSGGGHLSMPAAAPNGDVYVVWSEANGQTGLTGMMISRSVNGGASFGSPREITGSSVTPLPRKLDHKDSLRSLTYPVVAVDCSPKHPGRVYVTWAALAGSNGAPHIYCSYSDNQASSWSTPVVIDQDLTTLTDKFHPWISCDPVSGVVAIGYYDSRNDPSNAKVDYYTAVSGDGGNSWSPKRITNTNFSVATNSGYWADYTGIAAYKGRIIPCWTDQRGGASIDNTDVYISVISLGPNNVMNLAASVNSDEQTSISLRWTDPTTMVSGDPLTSFNVVIYRDSNFAVPLASVPKGTMSYRDSLLITGEYHSYQLFVATSTDTSDLVSAGAFAGGALQPQPAVLLGVRETVDGTELRWKNPTRHVDGTAIYDLSAVYFYVDGVRFSNYGQLPTDTGKIVTHVVNAAVKQFHTFSLAVATNRMGFTTPAAATDSMIWYSGEAVTTLSEGFESSPVYGGNHGAKGEKWVTSTLGAHSGTHCLCDNSVSKTQKSVNIVAMLPPVVIQAKATQLSFWDVPIVASTDSAVAEFTTDRGATWRPIARYTQTAGSSDSVQKSTWRNETFNMAPYVGDTVVIRFHMHSRTLQNKQGWYVDDVTFRAPNGVAQEPVLPEESLLITSAPNPFTAETWIAADGILVPRDGSAVSLKVFDVSGRLVADLTPQLVSGAGLRARFAAVDHPAGMYLAQLRIGNRLGSTRFVLQR